MAETSSSTTVFTKQQRIAELAKLDPKMGLTSLAQHMDVGWLYEAYRRTRPDGAVGVDGQSVRDFNKDLRGNLEALLNAAKSGTYRAPPVRRVHIPKGTGSETRPIGIPTFADKVLQRAVVMLLEPIYEQDFYPCSYGFRPQRSAHQALAALRQQATHRGGGWMLEVDIRKFFDTLDHAHLREFLRRRVRDGVVLRLIGKWLKAGVLEEGVRTTPDAGTPQGGVISPLLANLYLHYVLDEWFEREVQPRLRGRAYLIRYADDFVIGFEHEDDARRVAEVIPKRFAKYGLTVHPDKTRLLPFAKPKDTTRQDSGGGGPGTFDLLGFTHYWGWSWRGFWTVKRKTARDRLRRAIMRIDDWLRKHAHWSIQEQHQLLGQKLRGHYAYYGITGNYRCLGRFRSAVMWLWRKWLGRRNRLGPLNWPRFQKFLERFPLPPARVVHSTYRCAANPSPDEPYA
jgi:RNA-directed DNA polymerase